jgi:drug/metabolite transporter (DMT)-like permease
MESTDTMSIQLTARSRELAASRMTRASNPHFKTYVSLLVMVIAGPVGDVLLSKGMKHIAAQTGHWTAAATVDAAGRVFSSGIIWLGLACLIAYLIAEMVVLSWADYSYVQPASAGSYGVVALLGYFQLRERISLTRWIGVLVICLGVFIVGRTPPRTTKRKRMKTGSS